MKKNLLILSALVVAGYSLLSVVFTPVLLDPNGYLYSGEADGLKSYFNFSYYLKYDSGIRHDGINYPYGDHLQYINSHPLYLQVLKFIDKHIYGISNFGVGILNTTMLFSLLLAIPVLFLILKRFDLPTWFSFPASIIILFLTPQLHRIGGHYEMVYAFFIPLFWYLSIRWREGKKRWLWTALMLLVSLAGGFTSAYYVAFFSVFTLALFIVELWNCRSRPKEFVLPGIMLLIAAVLPLVIVKGMVNLTDWVDDRPANPWGFFIFHSNIYSIFLPSYSFIATPVGKIANTSFQWEGRAFVGTVPTFFVLFAVATTLAYLIQMKKPDWRLVFPAEKINPFLAASFLVLLFSMCIPFKWNMEFLLDFLPQLRQFRCLGRFSWIFYYVISVYTACSLYALVKYLFERRRKLVATALLIAAMAVWAIDARTNFVGSTRGILNANDKLRVDDREYLQKLEDAGIDLKKYQAILSLPFSNTCGDKLLSQRGARAIAQAMRLGNLSGLPLVQSFSPRLSFTHALSNYQLLAHPAIYKTRLDDMNDRPLLLLMTREELIEPEKRVQELSEKIFEDEDIILAKLPANALNDRHRLWKGETVGFLDSLECVNNICADTIAKGIYYNGFEDETAGNTFTGKGARHLEEGSMELFERELFSDKANSPVEISFWLFFDARIFGMPSSSLFSINRSGGSSKRKKLENREVFDVFGRWVRIATTLEPEENVTYKLVVDGKYVTVDDLLIRPANSNVFVKQEKGMDLFNNYPLSDMPGIKCFGKARN